MKHSYNQFTSMNSLDGAIGLEIIAAEQLSTHPIPSGIPILVTHIKEREHLHQLSSWLLGQERHSKRSAR